MKKIKVYKGIDTGLGLASNTYKQILQSGEMTMKELIAWAAGRGFSWLEVRDAKVEMTEEELNDMKKLADTLEVRLHYSWDNKDVLEEDEKFYKGMEHAVLFGHGTCCRVLIAPNTVKGQKGYTKEEMDKILPVLKAYVKKSEEMGISLCFENAMEPIFGDGREYFGMNELMERCPGMCMAFDAANATNKATCVNPSQEELLVYYQKFRDRIFYFHLKVTRDHALLDTVEMDGDFQIKELLKAFSSNKDMKICLEIPQQPNLKRMTAAVERSLTVLEEIEKEA
ncbi:hypothetical protein AALB16_06505 [Lachnospiraceae bacterium 62-35]